MNADHTDSKSNIIHHGDTEAQRTARLFLLKILIEWTFSVTLFSVVKRPFKKRGFRQLLQCPARHRYTPWPIRTFACGGAAHREALRPSAFLSNPADARARSRRRSRSSYCDRGLALFPQRDTGPR